MNASKYSDAEGVHSEAGTGWEPGGGDLPEGGSQPTYFNWKKKYDGLLPRR